MYVYLKRWYDCEGIYSLNIENYLGEMHPSKYFYVIKHEINFIKYSFSDIIILHYRLFYFMFNEFCYNSFVGIIIKISVFFLDYMTVYYTHN